jgi:hypothetical protein
MSDDEATRGQLLDLPHVALRESGSFEISKCPGSNVILREPSHFSQLTERIEITDCCHPGIRCFTVELTKALRSREERYVDPYQDRWPRESSQATT